MTPPALESTRGVTKTRPSIAWHIVFRCLAAYAAFGAALCHAATVCLACVKTAATRRGHQLRGANGTRSQQESESSQAHYASVHPLYSGEGLPLEKS
jgi:hypothetical protein